MAILSVLDPIDPSDGSGDEPVCQMWDGEGTGTYTNRL